ARNGFEMPASRLGSIDAGAAVAAGALDGRWRGRGTPSPASTGSATAAERPAAIVRRAARRSPDPVLQRVISGALLPLTAKTRERPVFSGAAGTQPLWRIRGASDQPPESRRPTP